jgi:S-adenosylmethionine:tRNA ribosyltransferase-isomerase
MLVVGHGGRVAHHTVADLPRVLGEQPPLIVRNDSRVVPARVLAQREDGQRFELLVCDPGPGQPVGSLLRAWVRGAKKLKSGDRLGFSDVELRYEQRDEVDSRACVFELLAGDPLGGLERAGQVPLPPYIERASGPEPDDSARYQTTFARTPGSVAAPTAGLHFEADDGLECVEVTLHVGPGTFLPMDVEDVHEHRVGSERFSIGEQAAERIESARQRGRRILAVGTTVCRTLESVAATNRGRVVSGSGSTQLVITPEHRWRVVDDLLTNFHLPKSSLLMLTCSFGGRERIMAAYAQAVHAGYRFYSYGDCMLVKGRGIEGEA